MNGEIGSHRKESGFVTTKNCFVFSWCQARLFDSTLRVIEPILPSSEGRGGRNGFRTSLERQILMSCQVRTPDSTIKPNPPVPFPMRERGGKIDSSSQGADDWRLTHRFHLRKGVGSHPRQVGVKTRHNRRNLMGQAQCVCTTQNYGGQDSYFIRTLGRR